MLFYPRWRRHATPGHRRVDRPIFARATVAVGV